MLLLHIERVGQTVLSHAAPVADGFGSLLANQTVVFSFKLWRWKKHH